MTLYPLKFKPLFQERIWGGRALEHRLGKRLPPGKKIGESWEVSDHPSARSVAVNGPLAGKTLDEILAADAEGLLGGRLARRFKRFPLLVKFLDANDWLSVQVHPGDEYAMRHENDFGKTEAWHIVHAAPGAKIVYGLKRRTLAGELRESLRSGSVRVLLNEVEVKTGETVLVPAGTLHAIGPGILLYEVQEASDVTYRLYDWDRVDGSGKPRALHVDRSLDVADLGPSPLSIVQARDSPLTTHNPQLVSCPYFSIEKHALTGAWTRAMGDGFDVVTAVEGAGVVTWEGGGEPLALGGTALIPAALRRYAVKPGPEGMTLLLTFVPGGAP